MSDTENVEIFEKVKQKRGRKPKMVVLPNKNEQSENLNNIMINIEENKEIKIIKIEELKIEEPKILKKRGRKPKGGKIIPQNTCLNQVKESKENIILHLKCSLKDLQIDNTNTNIESFYFNKNNNLSYEIISTNIVSNINNINNNSYNTEEITNYESSEEEYKNTENDTKEVWKKLKELEYNLHTNNVVDKKSACFWCTFDFDNNNIYIPKCYINNTYNVYGCFCSPECATAYLMNENIDTSTKFERYYLLNNIYSKVFDYTKNIKPAPNPYYMLDKYYGTLSIQDYRSLLRNERLFLIVDKPLTRILPELHEDNEDFIINNKIIPSNNTFQIKKKNTKNKNTIFNEKFGLTQ
jgi:hypothetical protein